jgi:hypothetical protein
LQNVLIIGGRLQAVERAKELGLGVVLLTGWCRDRPKRPTR